MLSELLHVPQCRNAGQLSVHGCLSNGALILSSQSVHLSEWSESVITAQTQ